MSPYTLPRYHSPELPGQPLSDKAYWDDDVPPASSNPNFYRPQHHKPQLQFQEEKILFKGKPLAEFKAQNADKLVSFMILVIKTLQQQYKTQRYTKDQVTSYIAALGKVFQMLSHKNMTSDDNKLDQMVFATIHFLSLLMQQSVKENCIAINPILFLLKSIQDSTHTEIKSDTSKELKQHLSPKDHLVTFINLDINKLTAEDLTIIVSKIDESNHMENLVAKFPQNPIFFRAFLSFFSKENQFKLVKQVGNLHEKYLILLHFNILDDLFLNDREENLDVILENTHGMYPIILKLAQVPDFSDDVAQIAFLFHYMPQLIWAGVMQAYGPKKIMDAIKDHGDLNLILEFIELEDKKAHDEFLQQYVRILREKMDLSKALLHIQRFKESKYYVLLLEALIQNSYYHYKTRSSTNCFSFIQCKTSTTLPPPEAKACAFLIEGLEIRRPREQINLDVGNLFKKVKVPKEIITLTSAVVECAEDKKYLRKGLFISRYADSGS